jgi:hypothetical protein
MSKQIQVYFVQNDQVKEFTSLKKIISIFDFSSQLNGIHNVNILTLKGLSKGILVFILSSIADLTTKQK